MCHAQGPQHSDAGEAQTRGLSVSILYCNRMGNKCRIKQYSKSCVKRPLQDQLSLNTGQKHCRMLQGEHSAIRLAFI